MEFIEFSLGRPSKRKKIRRNRRQIPKKRKKGKTKTIVEKWKLFGSSAGKEPTRPETLFHNSVYGDTKGLAAPMIYTPKGPRPKKRERQWIMLWEDAGPILKQSHKRIDALTFEQEAASVCVSVCWERNSHHNNVRRHLLLITAITQYATL